MSTEPDPDQTNGQSSTDAGRKARFAKPPRLFRQGTFAFSPRDQISHPHECDPLKMEKTQPPISDGGKDGVEQTKAEMLRSEGEERGSGLIASLRRYPKAVFFMLGNEFCERFSYYGMRAILLLYLIHEHQMTESTASLIYHLFASLAYFSPLIGSIAADNYFGRFNVILWVSVMYVIGHVLVSAGAIPGMAIGLRSTFDFSGLAVIALATGGIKPCVSAFAADQFPEDLARERQQFFSFFYFAINAGSLLAILLTPMLRGYVKCFGSEYCFPLAFGVPGVLMLLALILFIAGWRTYKKPPAAKGNIVGKVFRCIIFAARKKLSAEVCNRNKVGAPATQQHWLDYAAPKFSPSLIEGVKSMLSVLVLFLPVVFFWALFDQQGSTWILQANRMNGRVGKLTILPDQMNIFNPLIVLLCVPLFEGVIYPAARRMNINLSPLRKMAVGGLLASLSFVIAGLLQIEVNKTLEVLPPANEVFLQVYHNDPGCMFLGNADADRWTKLTLNASSLNVEPKEGCGFALQSLNMTTDRRGYFLGMYNVNNQSRAEFQPYDIKKTGEGKTRVYILADPAIFENYHLYAFDDNNEVKNKEAELRTGSFLDVKPGVWGASTYTLRIGTNCTTRDIDHPCDKVGEVEANMGAAHVMLFWKENGIVKNSGMHQVIRENSVNLLWQLPQFITITIGEVLFSVTGLEFSYSQASPNMKSVLQAIWLTTVALGNIIDMGISGSHIVGEPALEFFVYAVLMLLVMLIFIFLAMRYKYVNPKALVSPTESPQHELPPLSTVDANGQTANEKISNGAYDRKAD